MGEAGGTLPGGLRRERGPPGPGRQPSGLQSCLSLPLASCVIATAALVSPGTHASQSVKGSTVGRRRKWPPGLPSPPRRWLPRRPGLGGCEADSGAATSPAGYKSCVLVALFLYEACARAIRDRKVTELLPDRVTRNPRGRHLPEGLGEQPDSETCAVTALPLVMRPRAGRPCS